MVDEAAGDLLTDKLDSFEGHTAATNFGSGDTLFLNESRRQAAFGAFPCSRGSSGASPNNNNVGALQLSPSHSWLQTRHEMWAIADSMMKSLGFVYFGDEVYY
jgi:hypothetical protein